MSDFRVLKNADTGIILLERAKWCQDFWCHFRGLMFRIDLPENEGLLFVYERESRMDTSIHMLFCFFPIATVWLDSTAVVVDKVLAKPWRPAYAPRKPAQYFVEARPSLLDMVSIGDRLAWE